MSETIPPYDGHGGENPLAKMLRNPPLCGQCMEKHWPDEPHDPATLAYQTWFEREHGRRPLWKDAIAHCHPAIKDVANQVWRIYGIDPEGPADLAWPEPKRD